MAVLNLVVLEGGIRKQKASNTQTVDFASIRIGASNLQILETSGAFDFSAKKITNLAAATNASDAVRFDQLPTSSVYTADGNGIQESANQFSLELDGTTLSKSASGLKVAALGITNSEISASAAIDLSKLAALTASRVLVSDGSGVVAPSSVTSTTLGFLDATSSIQTQLNAKLALAGGTMTGAIAMGTNKITGLGDPTALQDAATKNYVDNQDALKVTKAGDTMTGTLAMGANKVTSSYVPDANNVLVNKLYVDGLIAGALWLNPIIDPNLINDSLSTPPGSPVIGDTYIAGATATGAWATFDGHAFMWNGSAWVNLLGRAVIAGDRFGVSMESAQAGAGGLLAKDDQIATVLSPTPGSVTYTFQVPIVSNAVYVNNVNSYHTGHQYDYTASGWVEFGGLNAVAAGIGLMYSGNALNINMGAGIVQLPSDEVGVDVHANGGLMTTVDNSASSTLTGAQLALKLADTSLAKSSSGVKANLDEDTLTLNSTVQVQHARSLTNDNAGSITAGQVVYIKSNGAVDLARADVAGLDSIWIGVVKASSIATTAAGLVVVRPGAIISGLSGLTPGVKQYISRATAGALTSSLTGFVTGEHVYSVGYAISATEMVYQPQFEYVF
jgi:hypothetical protein